MALLELTEESPLVENSEFNEVQTRIFTTTSTADIPALGSLASAASSSFPGNYYVTGTRRAPYGKSGGTRMWRVEVTAGPRESSASISYDGTNYEDEESFDVELDTRTCVQTSAMDEFSFYGFNGLIYESPCLIYRITRRVPTKLIVGEGSDIITGELSKAGMVNQSDNDPFKGAKARAWRMVAATSRRAGRFWVVDYAYKHVGYVYDKVSGEMKAGEWRTPSNASSDIAYPHPNTNNEAAVYPEGTIAPANGRRVVIV